MIAITALILLLLGVINAANIGISAGQTEKTMQLLLESESRGGISAMPKPGEAAPPPEFSAGGPKNDYDTLMSSNFFTARFDAEGSLAFIDVSHTSAVSEEEAEALAAAVYEGAQQSGKNDGKSGRFRFLAGTFAGGRETIIVFLDISSERFSNLRVLLLSAAAGGFCWLLMLLLVMLLSRKAIKPIAGNIEQQKQFVTNAGHELKTPLAIIQANTEAMELYNGENKWSKNIKSQIKRLDGLMKNLLFLARMEEGGAKVSRQEVLLSELLTEVLEGFSQSMELKDIALQREIHPGVVIYADQGQIEQLLFILLDNAIKYTNKGGEIRAAIISEGGRQKLQIENTCERLPDVPAEKLFDRFYRADTARTQKSGGYGIGLSVAATIAAANGAEIKAAYLCENRIRFSVCFL